MAHYFFVRGYVNIHIRAFARAHLECAFCLEFISKRNNISELSLVLPLSFCLSF